MKRTLLVAMMIFCLFPVSCGFTISDFIGTVSPHRYSGVVIVRWMDTGGTGWVVRDEGDTVLVVTAAHVVQNETHLLVDGILASVVAIDLDTDLAILRVEKYKRKWKIWQMADARAEEEARAVGYTWPNGLSDPETFLSYHGHVTTLDFAGFVAFNGGCFPGLSGGPLINQNGRVIGVCSQFGAAWGLPFETAVLFSPISNVRQLLDLVDTTGA